MGLCVESNDDRSVCKFIRKMSIKTVIFVCLFLRLSGGKQVGSPLPTKDYTKLSERQELYVFDKDGIAIISPKSNKVLKRIDAKTKLPGTSDIVCTPDFTGIPCLWGQAAFVPDRYIFAADHFGNRIIVIDVKKQLAVKAIKTDEQPHGVEYIAALGEIWVLCWSSTNINVIGVVNSTEAVVSSLTDVSLLGLKKSFKIQAKGHSIGPQGYFRGGNCQNPDKKLNIGVAFYKGEPGIHVINMTTKSSNKFINLEIHGCLEPKNIDFSSVNKYAFVQCLNSRFSNIIIIDVANEQVVHSGSGDKMVSKVIGQPFASPDGKYVLVLQADGVMSYYIESPSKKMVRLPDIPNTGGGFLPSGVAFIKRKDGYTAYVASTISSLVKTVALVNNTATLTGSITNIPNDPHAGLHPHKIASGCGIEDSYAAMWVQDANQTALIDTRNNTIGVATGIQSPKYMVWVDHKSAQSQRTTSKPPKIPSSGICHGPGVILTFLALLMVLLT
eukprot:Seg1766.6 transcript_id=Seg1766.6/GoldUCD/mRNA.D3Y31 product="Follistatin-related protein 4" protein_id=Seg1766.6/GoldUCD/D3Y31